MTGQATNEPNFDELFAARTGAKLAPIEAATPAPETEPEPAPAAAPAGDQLEGEGDGAASNEGGEATTGDAASEPPADDWIAQLPDEVRTRVEAERTARKEAEDRFKALHGKLAPTQRALNEAQTTLAQMRSQQQQPAAPVLPAADATAAETDSFFDSDKWKRFADDFPGDAEVMRAAFERQQTAHAARISQLDGQIRDLSQRFEQVATVTSKTELVEQRQALEQQHPDWQDINKSDEFWEWFDGYRAEQPAEVRDAFYDPNKLSRWFNDASFAGRMITRFKLETAYGSQSAPAAATATDSTPPATPAPTAATSARLRMSTAPNVRAGSAPPPANGSVAGLSEAEQFQALWQARQQRASRG